MTVNRGVQSWQGTDYPVLDFMSQIGSDFSSDQPLTISADLRPGTYSTSRIPGDAQTILDAGSFVSCGGDEPGTLTVQRADYDSDGIPTDFAASFDIASCDSSSPAHGEIRWNSTTPLELVKAPSVTPAASPVTVSSTADVTVQFTSVGDSPATMGAASMSQTPMSDGTLDWSIVADRCVGQTLPPGDSCSVTGRIAPIRPNGVPHSIIYATITVPDGQPIVASAQVAADVYPLSGQALALQARGAFRSIVLTWAPPAAAPAGWSVFHQKYYVYQYLSDGSLRMVDATSAHTTTITGLPDLSTARFVGRDEQSGADAPLSVSASATTASRELIYIATPGGILARQLAPQADASDSNEITSTTTFSGAGYAGLQVARNQSVLTYDVDGSLATQPALYICAAHLNAASQAGYCSGTDKTNQWDTAPSLSPDGARVAFTHAAAPGSATTIEIASTAVGATATTVPNSSGLTDATFNATGTGLVAVQAIPSDTELVTLSLAGTRAVIPGSAGLSDPDVASDNRIVAVQTSAGPDGRTTALELLAPRAQTPTVVAGAQTGTNVRPRFAADGASVYYTHNDTPQTTTSLAGDLLETGNADQIDLATGTVTELAATGAAGTPYILTADGTHHADTTAPTARLVAPSATVDLASTTNVSWTGADTAGANQVTAGVRNYDVRYRTAPVGHTLGSYTYPPNWHAITDPSAHVNVAAGTEYCFSVRDRDYAGNVSVWTSDTCTISPLDDRSLRTTATRHSSSSYYRHTFSYATKKNTTLTISNVTARRVGILTTTCAACGQIQVTLGSHILGRINTHASTTHYRQTQWLPATSTISGTLTIKTLTAAPVRIDGIVVQH